MGWDILCKKNSQVAAYALLSTCVVLAISNYSILNDKNIDTWVSHVGNLERGGFECKQFRSSSCAEPHEVH